MTKLGQKRKSQRKPIKKKLPALYALDIMFSKYIRKRAEQKCEYCGKSDVVLNCHHGVVHRRYMNTRFEPDNACSVCVSCHYYLSDFPNINSEWFKKRLGTERVEQLQALARSGNKIDREVIKKDLIEKLKE